MIQRIQSIFLVLVSVAMLVCVFSPIWSKVAPGEAVYLDAFTLDHTRRGSEPTSTSVFYIALLAGLAAIVALVSLVQYRNRFRQLILGLVNSLIMAALLGCTAYASVYQGAVLFSPGEKGTYGVGFYAVIAGLICNVVANRFIRQDEALVRSTDRMR
ncbi:MAG: DUF4293 domain-containing protein [Cytophagaceae bacterium]|nr:DUF4293 domain-containing protein [Cytophagaceae bacterium]